MISRKFITIFIAGMFLLLLQSAAKGESAKLQAAPKYKILHIMSYHSPWRWTDGQLDGFKEALAGLNAEYKVFQMDTKRNSAKEWKEKAGEKARALIDSWKPDLVYTTDDDVQEYVAKHYINKNIPFVFSGVNKEPKDYGFEKSRNITGVLEQEHFIESVKLLKEIVPKAKKIAVIFDDAAMWDPVKKRMKEKAGQLSGMEFISWDIISTFKEYKQKIKAYEGKADAVALIGVFTFKDETGKNVPYQEVLKWTAEHSKLPDLGFWIDRVHYGTLCAVTVSEYEQGLAAGKIARSILTDGKSPAEFTPKATVKGQPVVSLARAKKLGIKIKSGILLSSEVIKEFEWNKK